MARTAPELLFLHALPLDGSMWSQQTALLPNASRAPTLYGFGEHIEDWARGALEQTRSDNLIVVGCSVGGSCALEVAMLAPDRVSALVLIGTKARHRPEPALQASIIEAIRERGLKECWSALWAPLFSPAAERHVIDHAESIALSQSPADIAVGVTAFHTRPSRDRFLAEFPKPIVFVTGEDDVAPGVQAMAAQADMARDGRLHVIPDCGHYASLERPQRLNSILRRVMAALG